MVSLGTEESGHCREVTRFWGVQHSYIFQNMLIVPISINMHDQNNISRAEKLKRNRDKRHTVQIMSRDFFWQLECMYVQSCWDTKNGCYREAAVSGVSLEAYNVSTPSLCSTTAFFLSFLFFSFSSFRNTVCVCCRSEQSTFVFSFFFVLFFFASPDISLGNIWHKR